MKHIINYLGALLAVVLIGATFTACSDEDAQSANVGLGIKTFFPTKVVTNQPMTINGSGFNGVTEIEFPGGKKVTDFEIVGNDMIRVNAPSGIAADGGKIIVRTADDEAESHMSLTLGHTYVTGYSKQPGEKATGGELIDVFGSDLEFINGVELLDADGVPQIIDQLYDQVDTKFNHATKPIINYFIVLIIVLLLLSIIGMFRLNQYARVGAGRLLFTGILWRLIITTAAPLFDTFCSTALCFWIYLAFVNDAGSQKTWSILSLIGYLIIWDVAFTFLRHAVLRTSYYYKYKDPE